MKNKKGNGIILTLVMIFLVLICYVIVWPIALPFIHDATQGQYNLLTTLLLIGMPIFSLFALLWAVIVRGAA